MATGNDLLEKLLRKISRISTVDENDVAERVNWIRLVDVKTGEFRDEHNYILEAYKNHQLFKDINDNIKNLISKVLEEFKAEAYADNTYEDFKTKQYYVSFCDDYCNLKKFWFFIEAGYMEFINNEAYLISIENCWQSGNIYRKFLAEKEELDK